MASSEHNSTNYRSSQSSESDNDRMTLKDMKMAAHARAAANKSSKNNFSRRLLFQGHNFVDSGIVHKVDLTFVPITGVVRCIAEKAFQTRTV